MVKSAICAILKNEAPYLAEWIAYHATIGFDGFILFDNGSTDHPRESLLNKNMPVDVTMIDWPERPGQEKAYRHFFANFRDRYDWVAFIDVDEFINPVGLNGIEGMIDIAGDHPAMLINWMNFGPSGHVTKPPGLVIENFCLRLPENAHVNRHTKSFVRTSAMVGGGGPHITPIKGRPCDSMGRTIDNKAIVGEACHENVVINHYYTKSLGEWNEKVARGRAMVADLPELQRKTEWFEIYKDKACVFDGRINRWLPSVKKILSVTAPAETGR